MTICSSMVLIITALPPTILSIYLYLQNLAPAPILLILEITHQDLGIGPCSYSSTNCYKFNPFPLLLRFFNMKVLYRNNYSDYDSG